MSSDLCYKDIKEVSANVQLYSSTVNQQPTLITHPSSTSTHYFAPQRMCTHSAIILSLLSQHSIRRRRRRKQNWGNFEKYLRKTQKSIFWEICSSNHGLVSLRQPHDLMSKFKNQRTPVLRILYYNVS
jgi:hypothetical protein